MKNYIFILIIMVSFGLQAENLMEIWDQNIQKAVSEYKEMEETTNNLRTMINSLEISEKEEVLRRTIAFQSNYQKDSLKIKRKMQFLRHYLKSFDSLMKEWRYLIQEQKILRSIHSENLSEMQHQIGRLSIKIQKRVQHLVFQCRIYLAECKKQLALKNRWDSEILQVAKSPAVVKSLKRIDYLDGWDELENGLEEILFQLENIETLQS